MKASKVRREGLEKIVVRLETDAWHGHASETMWAEPVGGNRYRLRSVPFFARGLSVEDIVVTEQEAGLPIVTAVSLHAGHSTYRIFLARDISVGSDDFEKSWKALADLGCTYEQATKRLLGIDVPPHADIHGTYELLAFGESSGVWEFEEGNVSPNTGIARQE